ncbi:MAG: hypothetical protein LBS25_00255 [Candidatus Symbiothrix sp.]|jgi:hypothetical protein|nr:hypothetical protein [Candidatus Symbiothrix sp.]
MNANLNNEVVKTILEYLPSNIKPIDYLMELLHISRESAYRRMKSQIAFSFEEIALLSKVLKFSVNDIIGVKQNIERIFFDLHPKQPTSNIQTNFLLMYEEFLSLAKEMNKASQSELIVSSCCLPLSFIAQYESLFKLFYCKWLHQSNQTPVNCMYSKICLSPEMNVLRTQFAEEIKHNRNTTFVLDRNFFLPFIREVQYYGKLFLMTNDEINTLKTDLLALVDILSGVVQKGDNAFGTTCDIYVSFIDIEINSAYINYDEQTVSQYCIHGINSIFIPNDNLCLQHRAWFYYLKKSSMLITQSNEIRQLQFLNKQRELIGTVSEKLLW